MNNSNAPLESIVKETRTLLSLMGFESDVLCRDRRAQTPPHVWVEILVPNEGGRLIGLQGENLRALEHLLGRLYRAKLALTCRVVVDVNEYKIRRIQHLRALARSTARQVVTTQHLTILRPMTAYERRVIHVSLKNIEGVRTESHGEEPNRRIVIHPRDPLLADI